MDGDITLRQRLAAGDETALQDIYDRCSPLVYRLALRVTRSREAAEEITQDVFVHLWEHPFSFDPGRGACGHGWRCSPTGAGSTGSGGRNAGDASSTRSGTPNRTRPSST